MSTIQLKRGTGSAVPTGLADGELAINLDNNKLYLFRLIKKFPDHLKKTK